MTKERLRKTGEWYLYHSYKNENALIPVIIISFLVIFLHWGWILSIVIWFCYFCYCSNNNEKLNLDPDVIKDRAMWMKIHKKDGNLEECKRILGIS